MTAPGSVEALRSDLLAWARDDIIPSDASSLMIDAAIALLNEQDTSVCLICHGRIQYLSAPGDAWWEHDSGANQDHEGSPAGWVREEAIRRHEEDYR